jgi:5'-3' exonuclease
VLLIFDSHAIIFRAFYSIRDLSTPDGIKINAVYGFVKTILQEIINREPSHVLIAADTGEKTIKAQEFEVYKSNRIEAPEDIQPQFTIIDEFINGLSIPYISFPGYEADDCIASVVENFKDETDITIITGDRDLLQLVGEKVKVFLFKKSLSDIGLYGEKEVFEKYGFNHRLLLDYKALAGDSSDVIKGVAGIGEKTATDLIKNFGNIEYIYHSLDSLDIKDSVKKKLKEGQNDAIQSKYLGRLVSDLNFNLDLNRLSVGKLNIEQVLSFLDKYYFKSIKKLIEKSSFLSKLKSKNTPTLFGENEPPDSTDKSNLQEYEVINLDANQFENIKTYTIGLDIKEDSFHVFDGTKVYRGEKQNAKTFLNWLKTFDDHVVLVFDGKETFKKLIRSGFIDLQDVLDLNIEDISIDGHLAVNGKRLSFSSGAPEKGDSRVTLGDLTHYFLKREPCKFECVDSWDLYNALHK